MTYWHFARAHLLLTNEVLDIISHSSFLSISSQIKATESVPDVKWPTWREYFSLQSPALKKVLLLNWPEQSWHCSSSCLSAQIKQSNSFSTSAFTIPIWIITFLSFAVSLERIGAITQWENPQCDHQNVRYFPFSPAYGYI